MRVLLFGGEGTIGQAVRSALEARGHEVSSVGRSKGDLKADMSDPASLAALFAKVGEIDAVVATAGAVRFKPLGEFTPEDMMFGLEQKLMGQINISLLAQAQLSDGGSVTLTSGILNHDPVLASVGAATVNAALEGFVYAASFELPRGLRINLISPGLLEESHAALGSFFPGHIPVAGAKVAQAYVKALEGHQSGQVIKVF